MTTYKFPYSLNFKSIFINVIVHVLFFIINNHKLLIKLNYVQILYIRVLAYYYINSIKYFIHIHTHFTRIHIPLYMENVMESYRLNICFRTFKNLIV